MPFPWPFRGQRSPNFWDLELKAYIDGTQAESVAAEAAARGSAITAEAAARTAADNAEITARAAAITAEASARTAADNAEIAARTAADAAHVAAADPHPQYVLKVESPGTISYGENVTGTATAASGPGNYIPGTTIKVPPTTADVWLEWAGSISVTTAGQGSLSIIAADFTSGSGVSVGYSYLSCLTATPALSHRARSYGTCRVGPSDVMRTFYLATAVVQEGSSLAGSVVNGSGLFNTYLTAVAR